MSLTLYRKHNPKYCASEAGTQYCDKGQFCPIWVRGTGPDGAYVRGPIKTILKTGVIERDWKRAQKLIDAWEEQGNKPASAHVTIETWRTEYMALAAANNLSPETLRKYKHLFSQLEAYATAKGIRFIREFDLQTTTHFRLSWADGPLSTAKKLERLRSIMRFAFQRKWITENPALELKAPQVDQSPTLPFSKEEMRKIIVAAKGTKKQNATKAGHTYCQRVYTFILAMRSSGLRISDVTKLAVDSLKGNRLSLYQAKTGEHVSIVLDKSVADALRAVVPLNKNKAYFFWTGESKVPAAVSNWRKRIADVFTDAGIVNGHTHRFRDTFAVGLLENGATIENVSRLLGHTSIKITERHYSPWVKSRQDALDKALEGANGWLTELQAVPLGNVRQMAWRKP
ncbi:MAG: tyrosine-type recombinase/integrase [Candidatus Acidiferrales bacterium]